MLNQAQVGLLEHLLLVAADDAARAYSATWSVAKMRVTLVHACLKAGHRVIEPSVPGTPSHQNQTRRQVQRMEAPRADLQVVRAKDARPINIDLLSGTLEALPGADLSLVSAHRAMDRLLAGVIDAVLIEADHAAYQRLHAGAQGARADRQRREVLTMLPEASALTHDRPHLQTLGDQTLGTIGRVVHAFGTARVACAVYVLP